MYQKLLGISCPNLPQIMEAAEKDGMVAVLEEYIEGDSLYDLLKGALFTPMEARKITLQLCNALWVLHSMGAVHRDIKPENVIIRGQEAVLIDFDASRLFKNGSSMDTQVLGTTGYAAPEQYGISQTDQRADLYSLGILLNVMLTGKHPSKELAAGRLGHIVQKCTMVNPSKRYKNVLHLMEAL
ncbi:MAG: serine/threonine protein kinase [Candidatus Heritagella sp.]